MKIQNTTRLEPRRYTRSDGETDALIEVGKDGVEIDLAGAVLDGEDCTGIRAENVRELRIENCIVSDNHNPDVGWLPDSDDPTEDGFGGGIYLYGVSDSLIEGNGVNGNLNGIDLVRSDRNTIRNNNASGNSNIGIHLLQSSHNSVESNQADHCIRYTDRFWCDTADSAGVLLEEHSHHNRITDNSMRYSGDGLFIRANNRHSCDHNYVARNDASFSPNNAFEAVFSEYNVFEENIAEFSNYGFWLGYSRNSVVRGNRITANRFDGVSIEHGSHNTIEDNHIEGNRTGIRLWSDSSPDGADPSEDYTIRRNRILDSRECGIWHANTARVHIEDNDYVGNRVDVREDR